MKQMLTRMALVGCFFLAACGGSSFSASLGDVGPDSDPESSTASTVDSGAPDGDSGMDSSLRLEGAAPDSIAFVDSSDPPPIDSASGLTCKTPTSPMLTGVQGTHGGIQFHVTRALTLSSFDFTGSGMQDTVTLSDDTCNPIANVSIPGVFPPVYAPYKVNVKWSLQPGVSYRLTDQFDQTAYSTAVTTFPFASGDLVVEKGLVICPDDGTMEGQVWTAFTNLEFCQ